MKKTVLLSILAAAIPFIVGGCVSAHYVETGGSESVVTVGQINIQDYIQAGNAEDPMAKGLQQENEFMNDQKTTRKPDFTLSGKIIQTIARAGSTRQATY